MGNVFEQLKRMEVCRSAFDGTRAMIGRTPPSPPTLRGRASGAIIGLIARVLWWYTDSISAVFDAVAQHTDAVTSLLRIMLKREAATRERVEQLEQRLAALEQRMAAVETLREPSSQGLPPAEEQLSELGRRINRTREELTLQSRRLTVLLDECRKGEAERLARPSAAQAEMDAANEDHDLAFDDIPGAPHVRAESLRREYLPYLKELGLGTEAMPIVDFGCGTGEWLELLRENGLAGSGVERNTRIFETCRGKGLKVEHADALDYLRRAGESSFGAVTALQFVEHLPYKSLAAFLDETLRVLRPGGCLILETPNPENVLVGSYTFHMDPTHVHPLPSALLKSLVEWRGFCNVEIRNLHPYPDAIRFPETTGLIGARLNQYFYGPRDYALLAQKL